MKQLSLFLTVMSLSLLIMACESASKPTTNTPTPTANNAGHDAHGASSPNVSPNASMTPRIPDFVTNLAAARPLPKTLSPAQFSNASVKESYQIALEYPDVLAQQPCYCYCDTGFGHKSLLDCHIDTHSAECMVCMKEALLAGKMNKEGKNAEQIRAAIVRGEWKDIQVQ
jgi:hypothetical protein